MRPCSDLDRAGYCWPVAFSAQAETSLPKSDLTTAKSMQASHRASLFGIGRGRSQNSAQQIRRPARLAKDLRKPQATAPPALEISRSPIVPSASYPGWFHAKALR